MPRKKAPAAPNPATAKRPAKPRRAAPPEPAKKPSKPKRPLSPEHQALLNDLEYEKTNHALGRPVNVGRLLEIADEFAGQAAGADDVFEAVTTRADRLAKDLDKTWDRLTAIKVPDAPEDSTAADEHRKALQALESEIAAVAEKVGGTIAALETLEADVREDLE
jgi:hypothetical protein